MPIIVLIPLALQAEHQLRISRIVPFFLVIELHVVASDALNGGAAVLNFFADLADADDYTHKSSVENTKKAWVEESLTPMHLNFLILKGGTQFRGLVQYASHGRLALLEF